MRDLAILTESLHFSTIFLSLFAIYLSPGKSSRIQQPSQQNFSASDIYKYDIHSVAYFRDNQYITVLSISPKNQYILSWFKTKYLCIFMCIRPAICHLSFSSIMLSLGYTTVHTPIGKPHKFGFTMAWQCIFNH